MSRATLDLRRLRYFRAIAHEGSISAAARVLRISQPALTHLMNELEASARLVLLARSPRGITLTEAGTALLKRAEIILAEVESAEDELELFAGRSQPRRSLRLAMVPSIASRLTPAILELAAREIPGTILEIVEMRTNLSREFIAKGQFDLAVVVADRHHPAGLPLCNETLCLVSKPTRNPGARTRILVKELENEPLIVPADAPTRAFVEELARDAGIELNIVAEVSGVDSRKQAVLTGIGKTLLPYHTVSRECALGTLRAIPLGDPPETRLVALEYRGGLDRKIVLALRDILAPLLRSIFEDQHRAHDARNL